MIEVVDPDGLRPKTDLDACAVTGGTELVAIELLRPADSPRLAGVDEGHAWALADSDAVLPPILVHRGTMRVVDGMHRLRAAVLRGQEQVEVRFVDGSGHAVFVLAVEANIAHGLPLSLADREAAAVRILTGYPYWSDRAIAATTGLSAVTVGALRRRGTGGRPQPPTRIGRDGRCRPVNGTEGRRRASELMASNPDASLREIAKAVGMSPGTVLDVRNRLSRGEDPVTNRQRAAENRPAGRAPGGGEVRDRAATLQVLRRDPSLRFSENGRSAVRWLEAHTITTQDWTAVFASIPPHCRGMVADLARGCAESWREMAAALDRGQAGRGHLTRSAGDQMASPVASSWSRSTVEHGHSNRNCRDAGAYPADMVARGEYREPRLAGSEADEHQPLQDIRSERHGKSEDDRRNRECGGPGPLGA